MSGQAALMSGIYSALTGSAPLMALVSEVSQQPPQPLDPDAALEIVTFGQDDILPFDAQDFSGIDANIVIHTWSRYRGFLKITQMQDAIYDALHLQPITVTGYNVVLCRFQAHRRNMDPDGRTMHGISEFRLLAEEL